MSEPSERLTAAALQPLAETPELHLAASKVLQNMLPPSHPGAAAAIARWEALAARGHRALWRRALALALGLVSAWVLVTAAAEGRRYRRVLAWTENFSAGRTCQPEADMLTGLSEPERFRLFGDLTQATKSEQMRALRDSAADDPGCFAAYAIKYRGDHGEYPPDFLATARRLDPGNAWFTYLAAGELASQAVTAKIQSSKARRAGEPHSWKLLDAAKLEEALALLRLANQQAACVNRKNEFVAARMGLLPQADPLARFSLLVYLSGDLHSDINLRHLSEAIAAKARLIGDAGDAAQFKTLLTDADGFRRKLGGMERPSLIDVLIHKSNASMVNLELLAAAEKLGLVEDAARLGEIKQRFEQWAAAKKRGGSEVIGMHCGVFIRSAVFLTRNLAATPPPLADEDLQPGRMLEHLLAARVCSLALWMLLGMGLLALALYRFCLPQAVLRLAQQMTALLQPADWAWVLGGGGLLPFGYVTALTRLTPLGGQAWGLKALDWVLPAADFLALGLLLLVVPALIARWRLGRQAAALGVCTGRPWLGWLAVAAGMAVVPLLGLLEPPLVCSVARLVWRCALLGPLLLVILASVVRALAVSFSRQLSRAAVALVLIPAYAAAMLLLAGSVPVYLAAQEGWQQREQLSQVTPNGSFHCEAEVAAEVSKEVRELLE